MSTRPDTASGSAARGSAAYAARTVLLLAILSAPLALAQPPVTAEDAWVRAAPPGSGVFAAYLTLHNGSREPGALVAVSSPQFARAELHRSTIADGVARMEAVDRVEIPARGSVALEPGGLHLMLIDPQVEVRDGGTANLVLGFADGWTLELTVPVRRGPAATAHH